MTEAEILDLINAAEEHLSTQQLRLWRTVSIKPQKWQQHPWGDLTGGFWAVGVIGHTMMWFNETEEGFNFSQYSQHSVIDEYWCSQDDLNHAVQRLINLVELGEDIGPRLGPPQAVQKMDSQSA
jgi:hypothetical protein